MNHLESHITEKTFKKSAVIMRSPALGWKMQAGGEERGGDSRLGEAGERCCQVGGVRHGQAPMTRSSSLEQGLGTGLRQDIKGETEVPMNGP